MLLWVNLLLISGLRGDWHLSAKVCLFACFIFSPTFATPIAGYTTSEWRFFRISDSLLYEELHCSFKGDGYSNFNL